MNLSSPLILLCGAAHVIAANAEELDLYIREKFQGECTSCEEGNGCYLRSRAFFIQQSCFNRNDKKASVYDEVEDGVVCRQDFQISCDFEESAFDAAEVGNCKDTWNLDECSDSEHMTKLSGWCTLSTEPVGEFTTPLLTFQEYDDIDACGSSDYAHLMLADEGGACVPLSFQTGDDEYITGSRKVSCDGNIFEAVRYESDDCTGDAQGTLTDGSSEECPAEASDGGRVYISNCNAPTIHCKSSFYFGGGDEEADAEAVSNANAADGGGEETFAEPPPSASPAGGLSVMSSLLIMGMMLTSWIA